MTTEKRPPASSSRTCAGRHSSSLCHAAPGSSRLRSAVDVCSQTTSPVSNSSIRSHAPTSTSSQSPTRRPDSPAPGDGLRRTSRIDGSRYETADDRRRSLGLFSSAELPPAPSPPVSPVAPWPHVVLQGGTALDRACDRDPGISRRISLSTRSCRWRSAGSGRFP
eukprot:scaffold6882_cov117-Isochrysis_galbana.AAC.2